MVRAVGLHIGMIRPRPGQSSLGRSLSEDLEAVPSGKQRDEEPKEN